MEITVTCDISREVACVYLARYEAREETITLTLDTSNFPDITGMINLDFDRGGRLLGIEVLPATILPESVLQRASIR